MHTDTENLTRQHNCRLEQLGGRPLAPPHTGRLIKETLDVEPSSRALAAHRLCPVANRGCTLLLRAVRAAIDVAALLDAMADNPAATMNARRCHRVNCAFEAVEGHRPAILSNSERL